MVLGRQASEPVVSLPQSVNEVSGLSALHVLQQSHHVHSPSVDLKLPFYTGSLNITCTTRLRPFHLVRVVGVPSVGLGVCNPVILPLGDGNRESFC